MGSSHSVHSWSFHSHTHVGLHLVLLGSWHFNLWDLPWGVLLILDGLESLLLELLSTLEGVGIASGDTDEIGVEERDASGKEKTPNDEGLLGLLVISLVWGSGQNLWVFVAPEDVANVPDGQKAGGNNHELAGHEESGSGVVGVIREECNEESNSNEVWHKENDSNKHIPPVVGLVKKAVEHLQQDGEEQDDGEDSDCHNSALDWEATEALEVLGLLHGAVADAAAAQASLLFLGEFIEGLSFFWLLLLLGGFHKWGVLHSGGSLFHHHSGFVFH